MSDMTSYDQRLGCRDSPCTRLVSQLGHRDPSVKPSRWLVGEADNQRCVSRIQQEDFAQVVDIYTDGYSICRADVEVESCRDRQCLSGEMAVMGRSSSSGRILLRTQYLSRILNQSRDFVN